MELKNTICPVCQSSKLWNMSTVLEEGDGGNTCHILFSCLDCNSKFTEVYTLEYQSTEQVK